MTYTVQANLLGEPVDPWNEICCEACWTAEGQRCVCHCGGAYHGAAHKDEGHESDVEEDSGVISGKEEHGTVEFLSEQGATLEEYEQAVRDLGEDYCHYCKSKGKPHKLGPIEHYDHEGGWIVKGFEKRQWLYKTCSKCGYQWALWKLGVKRQ